MSKITQALVNKILEDNPDLIQDSRFASPDFRNFFVRHHGILGSAWVESTDKDNQLRLSTDIRFPSDQNVSQLYEDMDLKDLELDIHPHGVDNHIHVTGYSRPSQVPEVFRDLLAHRFYKNAIANAEMNR